MTIERLQAQIVMMKEKHRKEVMQLERQALQAINTLESEVREPGCLTHRPSIKPSQQKTIPAWMLENYKKEVEEVINKYKT